ncbi:MAG: PAS domain S-box protein [Deltaproteobacteria bacterium]|nr:PAS domain S-box protein [Deltaproteobacteria bacterium]
MVYRHQQWIKKESLSTVIARGLAIIRSLEASCRIGSRRMMGKGFDMASLINEIGAENKTAYILIAKSNGTLLLYQDRSINKSLSIDKRDIEVLKDKKVPLIDIKRVNGVKVLEIKKIFSPLRGGRGMMRGRYRYFNKNEYQIIKLGLFLKQWEESVRMEFLHTIISSTILLILSIGTIFFLFFVKRYKGVEEAHKSLKSYIERLIENLPDGLISLEKNGKIVTANPSALSIFSVKEDKLIGKSLSNWLGKKDLLDKILSKGEKVTFETYLTISPEKKVPVLVSASPLSDEQGKITGGVVLIRDLTEIKELEERLKRTEKLASLGRLSAGIAHEIRNPLSSIKGFAHLFAKKLSYDRELMEYATVMEREVDRLNLIITRFLQFAKPTPLKRKKFKIRELINYLTSLIKERLKEKNIIFKTDYPKDDLEIFADFDQLTQLLLNLIINGIEASKEGGELLLSIELSKDKNNIIISVSDKGEGIKEEDLAHIFDPFFSRKRGGTGLGLSIAQKIAEAHGGDIKVKSVLNKGTTFSFVMPIKDIGYE